MPFDEFQNFEYQQNGFCRKVTAPVGIPNCAVIEGGSWRSLKHIAESTPADRGKRQYLMSRTFTCRQFTIDASPSIMGA